MREREREERIERLCRNEEREGLLGLERGTDRGERRTDRRGEGRASGIPSQKAQGMTCKADARCVHS